MVAEMNPADVPDELVKAAAEAIHAHYAANPGDESEDNAIRVLLAAVLPLYERQLRAQRDEWHRQNGLLRGERDAATARAEQAETALAELREQLGKSRLEWSVLYVSGRDEPLDEADARRFAAQAASAGARLQTRVVGEWRDGDGDA